jgi:endonuclease G
MKQLFFLSVATAVLTGSCINEDIDDCIFGTPVAFTGSVTQLQTKVTGVTWNAGDYVGIYMVKAGVYLDDDTIMDDYKNKRYTAAASSALAGFAPFNNTPMYYPNNGSHVSFLAYHPWSNAITTDFGLPVNLNNQSNQSAIDILYAPATSTPYNNTSTSPVLLIFRHVLVKLMFSITHDTESGTPITGVITVSIPNQLREGILNLKNGEILSSGTGGIVEITSSTVSGATVTTEAIVFPGSTLGIIFTFQNSADQLFTASVPDSHPQWDGGYIYTYQITLHDGAEGAASITGIITEWDDGGTYPLTGTEVK